MKVRMREPRNVRARACMRAHALAGGAGGAGRARTLALSSAICCDCSSITITDAVTCAADAVHGRGGGTPPRVRGLCGLAAAAG
jgi:shikimate 5-dehydrogenase